MTIAATRALRLGTRASALALAQSDTVATALRERTGQPVTLTRISTEGDRSSAPIAQLGGTGVFVSALRDALLAGEIDFAVHSYKDLPTAPADGLVIAAVPLREEHRDALVARDGLALAALPGGATVGTGAPRRVAQLRAFRADLEVVPIRGNVDTRLSKVWSRELDAVVLAGAGLSRLGRAGEITEVLEPEVMLPAPAQGALAVECRADDVDLVALLAGLEHPPTRAAVVAERALLAALEAGCTAPVGAHAWVEPAVIDPPPRPGGEAGSVDAAANRADVQLLHLTGAVIALDGSAAVRMSASGATNDADAIGRRLAADLIAAGADPLMGSSACPAASPSAGSPSPGQAPAIPVCSPAVRSTRSPRRSTSSTTLRFRWRCSTPSAGWLRSTPN